MPEFVHIPLHQDPESLADALIADALPPTRLDEIRMASKLDAMALMGYLVGRSSYAAIEKEELIAFAEANRNVLTVEVVDMLERAVAREEGKDELTAYLHYILANMRHAAAHEYDSIDLRSDRLLWLLVGLSMQLGSGMLDYPAARFIVAKPEHRRHISSAALLYQTHDYVSAMDTAQAAAPEYIMLVAECALLTGDLQSLAIAWIALIHSPQPRDTESWADLIERASAVLERDGRLDADGRAFAAKVRGRFTDVAEDDF